MYSKLTSIEGRAGRKADGQRGRAAGGAALTNVSADNLGAVIKILSRWEVKRKDFNKTPARRGEFRRFPHPSRCSRFFCRFRCCFRWAGRRRHTDLPRREVGPGAALRGPGPGRSRGASPRRRRAAGAGRGRLCPQTPGSGESRHRGARRATAAPSGPHAVLFCVRNLVLLQQEFLLNKKEPSPPCGGAWWPAALSCGRAASGFSDVQLGPWATGRGPVTATSREAGPSPHRRPLPACGWWLGARAAVGRGGRGCLGSATPLTEIPREAGGRRAQ